MASLSSLPAEILSRIAQWLMQAGLGFEDDGICNLRLTCRALCLKTQYEFGRAAFSTLRLDLHPKTLQRLLTVCECPAFGEAVKKLVFAHWRDEYISFSDVRGEVGAEEVGQEGKTNFERQVLFVLRNIFNDAFRGMPNLGVVVIITPYIAPFQQRHPVPCVVSGHPSERCSDTRGQDEFTVEQFCVTADQLYTFITEASMNSGTRLSNLEITEVFPRWKGRYHSLWGILDHTFATSLPALGHMKHLKLKVYTGGSNNRFPRKGYSTKAIYPIDMLNTMQQLISLQLKFGGGYQVLANSSPLLTAICTIRSVHLPHLTSLTLSNITVLEDSLKAFILNHKMTLQQLHLKDVQIAYEGSWCPILTSLLNDMPALNQLYLGHIREGTRQLCIVEDNGYKGWSRFVGREPVLEGIAFMLTHLHLRDVTWPWLTI